MYKITFLVQLGEKYFFVFVFGAWISKKTQKTGIGNNVFSKESENAHVAYAIFCLKNFCFSCYKKKNLPSWP